MKKFLAFLLSLAMVLTLVACGDKAPVDDGAADDGDETPEVVIPEGRTEIVMWSNWTGTGGEVLQKIADDFNTRQDKYFLNLTFAGAYAEILAKYQATTPGNRPDLVCVSTEYVSFFADNENYHVNIQKYIDEDNYNIEDVLPHLRNSYSDADGNMMCAPLGNTVVGFFYNNDVLSQYGIDGATLNSYEEIAEACDILQAGGIETPFYIAPNSIYYTFPVTAQGYEYVDNNNGKDAVPTKSLINEGELAEVTQRFFGYITSMAQKGQLAPTTLTSADARQMFVNGEIAILSSTCSGLVSIGELCNWEVDFGFHPAVTVDAGVESLGECTGGGAVFMCQNNDENKERGAWEFLKVVMEPEYVVEFAMGTGYLPTTQSGYESDTYQAFVAEKFPTAVASYESQKNTGADVYNAFLPMFGDFHQIGIDMINAAIDDPTQDPADLTKQFAEKADECIELYTLSKG